MKYRNVFIGSISALAGILLVILVLINLIIVQADFLKYTNHKYKVEKNLSMSSENLDVVVDAMLSYVKGEMDSPQVVVEINGADTAFFNDKELGHLLDVRNLIQGLTKGMICLFAVCILGGCWLVREKDFAAIRKGIFGAWAVLGILVLGIGIAALIDIDIVITGFHQMFLAESNWILNPSLDRSVWMFMNDMYVDVILVMGAIVFGTAFASFLITKIKK